MIFNFSIYASCSKWIIVSICDSFCESNVFSSNSNLSKKIACVCKYYDVLGLETLELQLLSNEKWSGYCDPKCKRSSSMLNSNRHLGRDNNIEVFMGPGKIHIAIRGCLCIKNPPCIWFCFFDGPSWGQCYCQTPYVCLFNTTFWLSVGGTFETWQHPFCSCCWNCFKFILVLLLRYFQDM